jgi:hypothetical protein
MVKTTTPGRGFARFSSKKEERAFALWMSDQIAANGGRKAVTERTGLAPDNLSKWSSGRSIPSAKSLQTLIDHSVLPYASVGDLVMHSPWTSEPKYLLKAAELMRPARNQEIAPAPAEVLEPEPARQDLLAAILAEPGLSTKQKVQLSALAALIINGVDVQIAVMPR